MTQLGHKLADASCTETHWHYDVPLKIGVEVGKRFVDFKDLKVAVETVVQEFEDYNWDANETIYKDHASAEHIIEYICQVVSSMLYAKYEKHFTIFGSMWETPKYGVDYRYEP